MCNILFRNICHVSGYVKITLEYITDVKNKINHSEDIGVFAKHKKACNIICVLKYFESVSSTKKYNSMP